MSLPLVRLGPSAVVVGGFFLFRSYLREAPDVVRLVDGEVGAMPTLSEAMTGNSNANKNSVDNIKAVSTTKGGTDPTYLLARMKTSLVARGEAVRKTRFVIKV